MLLQSRWFGASHPGYHRSRTGVAASWARGTGAWFQAPETARPLAQMGMRQLACIQAHKSSLLGEPGESREWAAAEAEGGGVQTSTATVRSRTYEKRHGVRTSGALFLRR